ncbi:hypothetical protein B0H15DRAFT_406389 [Mycena belliarum]|uniref:Uncharacterized protein n=1 Tax=Mycena belliarum TaxID=1033014 RepID=A0AAD6XPJ1_9AGAR|nr:hypothetical protein B0H15DRAFT_406389 [Mycena belliae]
MPDEKRHPAAIAFDCVPVINVVLDQIRDSGAEWNDEVFQDIESALFTHKTELQNFADSIRAKPVRTLLWPKTLRDAATNLIESAVTTAAAADASSAQILDARLKAGMPEPEFKLPKPPLENSSGPDLTAQKLADHIDKIVSAPHFSILLSGPSNYGLFSMCE